jgi:hypothetical protein
MGRHLENVKPDLRSATLVLMEYDGTEHVAYKCGRSFWRIQRYGRWFRLNGRDVYLPEDDPQGAQKHALQKLVDQAEELGLYDKIGDVLP